MKTLTVVQAKHLADRAETLAMTPEQGAEILADELRTSRLAFSGALLEISTLKRQRGELIEALQDIVNSANDLEQDAYHIKVARTALERGTQ